MSTYSFAAEQTLPVNIDVAFAFFSDAHNLERITPPFLHFEVVTPDPIVLREGCVIDYRLRLRGIPIRWQSQIVNWRPPHRFTDVQLVGPYTLWDHTHTFEAVPGGALIRDEVVYSVPGGPIVERLLVRPDIRRIFAYRQRILNEWARGALSSR